MQASKVITAALLSLASVCAHADDVWTPPLKSDDGKTALYFKFGTYQERTLKASNEGISLITVRMVTKGENPVLAMAAVKHSACKRGSGTVLFYDGDERYLPNDDVQFFLEGGTVASAIADTLCDLYREPPVGFKRKQKTTMPASLNDV